MLPTLEVNESDSAAGTGSCSEDTPAGAATKHGNLEPASCNTRRGANLKAAGVCDSAQRRPKLQETKFTQHEVGEDHSHRSTP
jgi:hypothetical protein